MASTGTKEYTLKINGISKNITDVTKLEDVLINLDNTIDAVNKNNVKIGTSATAAGKALNEEEKAAKKLADTQKRLADANSAANKAQIEANLQLRERTREVTRQIQINQLAEGSIAQMGMTLTDLRNSYEDLSAAERNQAEIGGVLLTQIQALDAEYKALRESTGNFRDSVGNYEKALKGLGDLKDGFEKASKGSVQLSSELLGNSEALSVVTETTDTLAKSTDQLNTLVSIASSAQEAYNAVTKEGVVQQKAAAVMDAIRAVQLRAKTAAEAQSTKGTIVATIAQTAFNIVANANPYVLLALALITVVGALALFASNTDKSAESQRKLNEAQAAWLEYLDAEADRLNLVSTARINAYERQIQILTAQGNKTKEIRKLEDDLNTERRLNNARLLGFYAQEVAGLEGNRSKLEQYYLMLLRVKSAQARGDTSILLDIDLNGKVEKVDIEKAVETVQQNVDLLNKKIQIAVDLRTEQEDIRAQIKAQQLERIREDKELAKTRADLEREAVRAAEDARLKLIENGYARARRLIKAQYARDIADLRLKLVNEKNLTETARAAINANIVSLGKLRDKELAELDKERAARELETQRQLEDSRNALILGQADRARAEVNANYDRIIQDLQKRLDTEKDLTKAQQKAITEEIKNAQLIRGRELDNITVSQAKTRTDQELAAIDFLLQQTQNKVGEFTVRNKDGLKLIDVKKTKANYAEANAALGKYIGDLKTFQDKLLKTHLLTLNNLEAGTTEYEEEVQRYAQAEEDVTQKIKKAQKDRVNNTKESNKVQTEYYKDLFEKIGGYADAAVSAVGAVFDTISQGVQMQIDDLNTQLEDVNEHFEEAKKQREEAVKNVETLEEQLQTATGGTATALKEQLADAMHARQDADREEKRLAKEKEKREEEIRKKEKQIRRNDLIAGIAQGIANTAQAVTKALTLVWPLNLIVAGLVGAAGAVQVGLMTKQLTKLADGGEIKGPSHAQGGVPIGLGYEAEGGEYVVNKRSYGANADLVKFINESNGSVSIADLMGLVPASNEGIIDAGGGQSQDGRLLAAIEAIDLQPVVSVKDINDVNDNLATVQDLADYGS